MSLPIHHTITLAARIITHWTIQHSYQLSLHVTGYCNGVNFISAALSQLVNHVGLSQGHCANRQTQPPLMTQYTTKQRAIKTHLNCVSGLIRPALCQFRISQQTSLLLTCCLFYRPVGL